MKKIIICLITVLMLFATIGCSNQYEGLTKIENELFEVYIPDTYNEQKKMVMTMLVMMKIPLL